jgi:cellulose synthase/poly-beta-1,6-N-acetylglucosamine synthase-like glycosyltransferase
MAGYIIKILFLAINIILALHFLQPVFFFLLHLLIPSRKKKWPATGNENIDFAAIVTVHRDTRFIPPLVDSFLKQEYQNFILYIVADDCIIQEGYMHDERVRIFQTPQPFNAKIKSIAFAVEKFIRPHDVVIIFDSDNLVHPRYFKNLMVYFTNGFRVVQTHMLSKNISSVYSRLDSIGHIYHTFCERFVKMKFGLSSAILGLGIAMEKKLYDEIMYRDTLGGFDKKLQVQLAKKVKQIAFAADAVVYDEKVDEGDAMEKQRTRWIYAYFKYFKDGCNLFVYGFVTRSMGRILLGFNMMRPPLFITITAALLLMLINIFVWPVLAVAWAVLLFCFALNFILIIATQSRQKGMLPALLHIPKMVIRQVRALFKIKTAARHFLKTEHHKIVYIDDILNNEPV